MRKSHLLFAAAALALAAPLAGCGKSDEGASQTRTSAAAARAGSASPLDTPFKLSGAQAIDVDALFSILPEGRRPSYESARFDSALGAMVVTNLRVDDELDPSKGFVVARAELYGVDVAAIERIKSNEGAGVDAPFEKVFDKIRFLQVTPVGDGPRIGGVEFDQLRVRQGGLPEGDDENGGRGAALLFNAFDLAGLYFKDLTVAGSDGAESPHISVKAPDLRIVGVGGGKLNALIANDFEYSMQQTDSSRAAMTQAFGPQAAMIFSGPLGAFLAPDAQRVTVKSVEWRNIDASGLLAHGLKGEKPPATARNLLNLGSLKAVDVETFVGGKRVSKVAETTLSAGEFTGLLPSKIRSETKGATYDFAAYLGESEAEAAAVLKRHGLDNVKGDGTFAWDWDGGRGSAGLKTDFKTDKLADFTLAFDIEGMKAEKFAAADEHDNGEAFREIALKSFNLSIRDKKMLDAIFDIAALQMGGSGADLRQSAPAMIRLSGAQAAAISPRMGGYVEAVANFVAQGGTLEIAAKPAQPVTVESIGATAQMGPQAVPDMLNLTVTHKK